MMTREPVVAGMFYPDDRRELEQEVRKYLEVAPSKRPAGTVRGLISPHAGYVYSGGTAAAGYRLLRGRKYDAVVVVGPSHRDYFDGISIYPGDAFRTPFGAVAIHDDVRKELLEFDDAIRLSDLGHRQEHSVEVQLPFIQEVLGDFKFVQINGRSSAKFSPAHWRASDAHASSCS